MVAFMCGDLERESGCSLGASRTRPVCRCFRGALSALVSLFLCLLWISGAPCARCVEATTNGISVLKDMAYKPAATSAYEKERCKLDLYLLAGKTGFPTLVWFHGGALKEGSKDDAFTVRIVRSLASAGLAVATVNYRLSPKATYPAYVEDAAAGFAWVRGHISEHGGDPKRVFIGGHSAGAYLTLMVGLDPRYLRQQGIDATAIAGLIPVSGQTMTHYTIRDERGLDHDTIIADKAAPIHYVRKDAPPMLVLYADHDMPARAEENQYLVAALKAAGDTQVRGLLIRDRDHGTIAGNIAQPGDPAAEAILSFTDARVGASMPSPSRGEGAGADCRGLPDATVFIIPHAEKPKAGQGLSPTGKLHAKAYVDYFRSFSGRNYF